MSKQPRKKRGPKAPSPTIVVVKMQPLAVSTREAAALLSISVASIGMLVRVGELECFYVGRSIRITTASITGYIERKVGEGKQPRQAIPLRPDEIPDDWLPS